MLIINPNKRAGKLGAVQIHCCLNTICVPQVQNGIATYATWTTIATLLNFTVVLSIASVSPTNAATASLCILLLEVIIW